MSSASPSPILLFVKHPAPGSVKSRISAAIGADEAAELYRRFVFDLLDTARSTDHPIVVFVTPGDRVDDVRSWLGSDLWYHPQQGAELGQRMERAFRAIFAQGADRAALIGSDLPDLPIEILHEAMEALDRHEAVIGPARDGGYYLIGFRREGFLPGIFRGIELSVPDVLERTLGVFRNAGTTVHLLPPWQDVDTIQDLRDLVTRSEQTAFAASRTMRYLGSIRDRLTDRKDHHGQT